MESDLWGSSAFLRVKAEALLADTVGGLLRILVSDGSRSPPSCHQRPISLPTPPGLS